MNLIGCWLLKIIFFSGPPSMCVCVCICRQWKDMLFDRSIRYLCLIGVIASSIVTYPLSIVHVYLGQPGWVGVF